MTILQDYNFKKEIFDLKSVIKFFSSFTFKIVLEQISFFIFEHV